MEHIKPHLKALHWLPVRSRIHFKVATLAYRCLHGLVPFYLAELASLHEPKRSGLRSETDMLKLVVPPARKERWGGRAFSCCAPRIWNAFPSLFALSQLFLPFEPNSRILCSKLFFPKYCTIHLL
jgi:hypothetical protein